jgi:hypothetical protein
VFLQCDPPVGGTDYDYDIQDQVQVTFRPALLDERPGQGQQPDSTG